MGILSVGDSSTSYNIVGNSDDSQIIQALRIEKIKWNGIPAQAAYYPNGSVITLDSGRQLVYEDGILEGLSDYWTVEEFNGCSCIKYEYPMAVIYSSETFQFYVPIGAPLQGSETPVVGGPDFYEGEVLLDLGKYFEAIGKFNQAIAKNPNNAEFWDRRGTAYFSINNFPQAIKDHAKAILLSPDNGFYYHERGLDYAAMGSMTDAVANFKSAARLGYFEAQSLLKSNNIPW